MAAQKRVSRLKRLVQLCLLLVVCIVIVTTLVSRAHKRKKLQELENAQNVDQSLSVKVAEVTTADIARFIRSSAVIRPWQEARISAEVSGKVKALHAKVGDLLRPGDPILKTDDEMFTYRVEDAQGRVLQLEASHQASLQDLKRNRKLYGEKVISDYEIEQARSREKGDRGSLVSARAALKIARRDLRKTLVSSPIQGVLAELPVDLGTDVTVGQSLASVVDIAKVKIVIGLTGTERSEVREGQAVQVTTMSCPDEQYHGTVYSVGMKADDTTLTFPVEIAVENSREPLLKPGMVAQVAIRTETFRGVIAIAQELVLQTPEGPAVWTVDNGRARKTMVAPGRAIDSRLIINGGLKPGDLVVTSGHENLIRESPVRIIQ